MDALEEVQVLPVGCWWWSWFGTFLGEAKTDEKLYVRFSLARQATP